MLTDVPGAGENWTAWFIVSKKKVNYYNIITMQSLQCHYNQCSKLLPVRQPVADNFEGGLVTF